MPLLNPGIATTCSQKNAKQYHSPLPTSSSPSQQPVTWLSLPNKPQLLILALCRLSEPLSNTCLLPYIYYLIRSIQHYPTTSTPAQISRQAGLLISLFALAQFATSVPWSYMANKHGRKPSILLGLTCSIIASIGFGFSTTVPAVMFWRIVAGIGNGNTGVMRTMTAEIVVEKRYQSRAFLLLPLVFNSGVVIGLALGGGLADPITNLPSLFGAKGLLNWGHNPHGVEWMQRYPFALPTLCNATALTVSLILAILGLRETAPGKTEALDRGLMLGRSIQMFTKRLLFRRRPKPSDGYMALSHIDGENLDLEADDLLPTLLVEPQLPVSSPKPKLSIASRGIYSRSVLRTIVSFGLLPLHNSAFMNLFPVFLSTPPSSSPTPPTLLRFSGGLGLASPTIGLFLSAFSIYGILIQILIYPTLQTHLGTLGSYRLALTLFLPAYVLTPYVALLHNYGAMAQGLAIIGILFLQVTARTFAIPSSVILLTNAASESTALAAVHGVGNMIASLARAVGPAVAGAVFAWGLERRVVGFVWWTWALGVAVVGSVWGWTLLEPEEPLANVANYDLVHVPRRLDLLESPYVATACPKKVEILPRIEDAHSGSWHRDIVHPQLSTPP